MHLKSIYALSIYALNFRTVNFLSLFLSFILSDGTQGNKHTEQFPSTDGEGQSHSSHNHYAAEKLTLCLGFQSLYFITCKDITLDTYFPPSVSNL